MGVQDLIRDMAGRGWTFRADPDGMLAVEGPPLSDEQRMSIRTHRDEILAHLAEASATEGDWSPEDWRALCDERAGILEFDQHLPRREAEAMALDYCVAHWLNRNPPRVLGGPGRCAFCGRSGGVLLPFLVSLKPAHAHVHDVCHGPWMAMRGQEARKALAAMGVAAVDGGEHDHP